MNELVDFIFSYSGPLPHATMFFTFACILGWWTKEIRQTMLFMVIWSMFAEWLQLFYPTVFQFSIMDIFWNITGSAIGILAVQIALFVSSGMLAREEGWDEIRKDVHSGNLT